MICNKCGSHLPDDAKECEFCGATVDASADNGDTKILDPEELAAAAAGAEEIIDETGEDIFSDNDKKRREQMEKMMEDKKKQLSEIEKRRNEKRKKQRRKKIAIIALICAAAAAAAGFGAHFIITGMNGNSKTTEQTLPLVTPTPDVSASPSAEPSASPSVDPSLSPSASPDASASPGQTQGTGTSASPAASSQSWTSTSSQSSTSQSSSSGRSSSSTKTSGSTASKSSSSSSGSSSGSSSSGSASTSSSKTSSTTAAESYANASDSGIVTDKITSRIVTGGEVIQNGATGKLLMTFVMGGTRYYANVSPDSSTEQIKGRTYTIDADATSETYNGNTIYEISSITGYEGDYILPESGTRLLTQSDLKGLSKYDLALARNEIYARHGRKFQTQVYSQYFSAKSWYKINPNYNYSNDNSNLNDIERKNIMLILDAEK